MTSKSNLSVQPAPTNLQGKQSSEWVNLLFIEDDLLDQMAFKRFVHQHKLPYNFTMSRTIKNAVAEYKSGTYHMIISDFRLIDGTAFDFLEEVGKPNIPFVLMTGGGDEEIAVQALKWGAEDYLVKEIDNGHLEQIPLAIKKALRKKTADDLIHLTQYEQSRAAHLSLTKNGMLLHCNKTFAQLVGWKSVEELLCDDSWLERIKPIFSTLFLEVEQNEGFLIDREINLRNRQHELIIVKANLAILPSTEDAPSKLSCTLIDITNLRKEEKLRHEREIEIDELQKTLQLREDFSDMLVHDLRNPLAIITLASSMLNTFNDDPKIIRKLGKRISNGAEKLQLLIDDLLTVARLERGNLAIEPEDHNLVELAKNQVQFMDELANGQNVTLKFDHNHCSQLSFPGDKKLIQRVFDNLISNAIKYSPSHSTVSVFIQKIVGQNNDQYLQVQVKDNGKGVPIKDREKVFERFGIGSVKGERGKQIGLGLSFCKMVIEAHGGNIWISDNSPSGAIFNFSLPIKG